MSFADEEQKYQAVLISSMPLARFSFMISVWRLVAEVTQCESARQDKQTSGEYIHSQCYLRLGLRLYTMGRKGRTLRGGKRTTRSSNAISPSFLPASENTRSMHFSTAYVLSPPVSPTQFFPLPYPLGFRRSNGKPVPLHARLVLLHHGLAVLLRIVAPREQHALVAGGFLGLADAAGLDVHWM